MVFHSNRAQEAEKEGSNLPIQSIKSKKNDGTPHRYAGRCDVEKDREDERLLSYVSYMVRTTRRKQAQSRRGGMIA